MHGNNFRIQFSLLQICLHYLSTLFKIDSFPASWLITFFVILGLFIVHYMLAWNGFWPSLGFGKAKAVGLGWGFERYENCWIWVWMLPVLCSWNFKVSILWGHYRRCKPRLLNHPLDKLERVRYAIYVLSNYLFILNTCTTNKPRTRTSLWGAGTSGLSDHHGRSSLSDVHHLKMH